MSSKDNDEEREMHFFYMNYIIHCKIKRHNHRVRKTVRVLGNKTNPKKIK